MQLSQAMALAVVVTWTVCAVADVGTGSTMLVMTGNAKPKSEQIESRTLEQIKGHLRSAAGQFRLHPSPAPWLTAPMMIVLGSPWPDAAGGAATWYRLVHQNPDRWLC
ncbi:MAG: hypothetical protein HC898_06950 [Phycisphaerales bacterium]|nr:hypothetical protein [Phycisphaerales bacterium]